jgi:hypothetical protein
MTNKMGQRRYADVARSSGVGRHNQKEIGSRVDAIMVGGMQLKYGVEVCLSMNAGLQIFKFSSDSRSPFTFDDEAATSAATSTVVTQFWTLGCGDT